MMYYYTFESSLMDADTPSLSIQSAVVLVLLHLENNASSSVLLVDYKTIHYSAWNEYW